MKFCLVLFLFVTGSCFGQTWEAEILAGVSGYKGDLIKHHFAVKSMMPAVGVNLKYNFDNFILLRAGISWLKVTGDDKNNKQVDLRARNLSFKSDIIEASLCVEYNLLEPEIFDAYPYIFGGIGVYHFNSYTYDDSNKKTWLRPLSTEGQGLAAYPGRKPYSQTQLCLPFGAGWKWNFSKRYDIIYEIGYRVLFTDYLDDVSKTYVDPQLLLAARGPKAVEVAYRAQHSAGSYPFQEGPGDQRGNPNIRDWYFFSGLKLLIRLGKEL
jgi:hypothetical protein